MSNSPFFITTPIYYSNDIPHIGHAYATLIADVIARDRRYRGYDVRFSTGVDENSQKVVEKALEKGVPLEEYINDMAEKHKSVWDALSISYTDFVRTHHPSQTETVRYMLQKSFDNDDIYLGHYDGSYCVGCEAFKKPSDLTQEGYCPIHKKPVTQLQEENYFFRLSKYSDRLLAFYDQNPELIQPNHRRNEIIEFIKGGLEDFSVSRAGATFGIPLPFDPKHITYVWYDALFNYISILVEGGELTDSGTISSHWPADVHVMGKDITRFHGIYWPAMLMSVGLSLPRKMLTTGFFTINGEKMSKSLGNVINPIDYIHAYSRDLLVVYLMLGIGLGNDGDFNEEESVLLYNAHLANNLGNLINRLAKLWIKVYGFSPQTIRVPDGLRASIASICDTSRTLSDSYEIKEKLEYLFESARDINKHLDTHAPWKKDLSDAGQEGEYKQVLGESLLTLLSIASELRCYFPEKMERLLSIVRADLHTGNIVFDQDLEPLFPRLECQNITKNTKNT